MPTDSKPPEIVARYGCATLDELVAKHAEDVSPEGILLRATTALPTGKLVDFEVQLASGESVLAGAGRIVWTRPAPEGERPAGVAVKFVDLDEASQAVVDQLLAARMTTEGEFELPPTAAPAPAPAPAPSPIKRTVLGMGSPFAAAPAPAPAPPPAPPPAPAPAPAPAQAPPLHAAGGKTKLGLSAVQLTPEEAARAGTHTGLAPVAAPARLVLASSPDDELPVSRPQATSDIDQAWVEPPRSARKVAVAAAAPTETAEEALPPKGGIGRWIVLLLVVLVAGSLAAYRFRVQLREAGLPEIPTIDGLPSWLSGETSDRPRK